jgi:hypothetical protein
MPKTKKRDSAYYLKRLQKEHPHIHAELVAGKLPSVRAAAIKAGLIHLPRPLTLLMREWKKASIKERREFMDWIAGTTATSPSPPGLVDRDGQLSAAAIRKIEAAMAVGRMRHGDVMEELGYSRLDPRLGMAMAARKPWKPDKKFLNRLESFLRAHRP